MIRRVQHSTGISPILYSMYETDVGILAYDMMYVLARRHVDMARSLEGRPVGKLVDVHTATIHYLSTRYPFGV